MRSTHAGSNPDRQHRFIGATVRATNRTYGLAPAVGLGDEETVIDVDPYDCTVRTAEGNLYFNGSYTVVRMVETGQQ